MQSKSRTHTAAHLVELLTKTPTLTNVELANTLGVTRQRVSQVRRELNLPPVPSRKIEWHPCRACGKLIRSRRIYCNRACQFGYISLTCETCGVVFHRSRRVVEQNKSKGYKHIWCGKQCQGSWFGSLKRRLSEIVSR